MTFAYQLDCILINGQLRQLVRDAATELDAGLTHQSIDVYTNIIAKV